MHCGHLMWLKNLKTEYISCLQSLSLSRQCHWNPLYVLAAMKCDEGSPHLKQTICIYTSVSFKTPPWGIEECSCKMWTEKKTNEQWLFNLNEENLYTPPTTSIINRGRHLWSMVNIKPITTQRKTVTHFFIYTAGIWECGVCVYGGGG